MPRRKVLAIGEDATVVAAMARSIESLGAEVEVGGGASSVSGPLPHRYTFYAWDDRPESLVALLPHVRGDGQLVVVARDNDYIRLIEAMRDPRVNHIVVPEKGDYGGLVITATKLFTGDIFGIEKYLPPATQVRYVRLDDYAGRTKAIDSVTAFAEECGIRSKVRAAIAQACEELLMNALYDAPIDEQGNVLFGEVSTKARLEQRSPRPVSIRYAATEDRFALAVRDRFGRLEKDTILRYLHKCAAGGATQIDRKTLGAGLGLYLVTRAATEYVCNVAPGMATEVVCTFDRKAARSLRVLSVFVHPGMIAAGAGAAAGTVSAAG